MSRREIIYTGPTGITLNNERDLLPFFFLFFSFYFSTIRSNARAHAVWPREGEDREARGGKGGEAK